MKHLLLILLCGGMLGCATIDPETGERQTSALDRINGALDVTLDVLSFWSDDEEAE